MCIIRLVGGHAMVNWKGMSVVIAASYVTTGGPVLAEELFQRAPGSQFQGIPDPLQGPLSPVGKAMQDWGVSLHGQVWEQVMNNVTEGSKPGVTASSLWILPTADFDLQKIVGIPNARIRMSDEVHLAKENASNGPTDFQSAADSGSIGDAHRLIRVPDTLRELSYEQLFLDGHLDLEAGRINPKPFFWSANCVANYLSCQRSLFENNTGLPPGAFSTWMGRAEYNFTPNIYVQVGAVEINPNAKNTDGFDFGTSLSTGVLNMGEVAYKTSFASTPYPSFYELGGWYDTAPHNDPLNAAKVINSSSTLQFNGSQTIWRQDAGGTKDPTVRHLDVYTLDAKSLDPTNVYSSQVTVGTSLWAPIESRPFDSIGAKVTYLQLTDEERKLMQMERLAAGGPNVFPAVSWYFELNGHIQLTPYAAIEPVVQYVLNPDTLFNMKVPNARSGWVLSITVVVDPMKALGLGG